MNNRITVVFLLIAAILHSTSSADECRKYMTASTLYDAASNADLSGFTSNAPQLERQRTHDAVRYADRAMKDAVISVHDSIKNEKIIHAIDGIYSTLEKARIAGMAIHAWSTSAKLTEMLNSKNDTEAEMGRVLLGVGGKFLGITVDSLNAYYDALKAFCLQMQVESNM